MKPRIYVASLADFNAGRLHGQWIDANQSVEEIQEQINAMLSRSAQPVAEDWAIHDFDDFGAYGLKDYESIEFVAEAARLIVEHGPVFAGLLNHFFGHLDEAKRYMEDGYHGAFQSLREYLDQFIDDCYGHEIEQLPEFIRHHIDYDGIARDMEHSGDVFTIECDGVVHVFDGNP